MVDGGWGTLAPPTFIEFEIVPLHLLADFPALPLVLMTSLLR